MRKNVAAQSVGATMVSASDGSAFSGTVTVYVTGDGGTQAIGSVGSGVCTYKGQSYYSYAPSQAETNYDHVAYTFIGTGAVPATVQLYTFFPETGDSFARLGAPVGASISADVAGVQADTDNIQTRLPTALVSGRMDSSTGAMAANVMTAAAAAADLTTELQTGLATASTVTAIKSIADKLDTALELDGSVYHFTSNALEQAPTGGSAPTAAAIADEVQTRTIAAVTLVNGLAANTVTAAALATDAVTEIQTGLATASALAAVAAKTGNLPVDPADASDIAGAFGTVNATLTTISGYIDTEIGAIKAKTDLIPASPAATGSIPSASAVAAAVWDEAVDGAVTARQSVRLANSANGGKVAGMGTASVTLRDLADTKARVTASVDSSGNRTAVTRDLS